MRGLILASFIGVLACGPTAQPAEGPRTHFPFGRWAVACGQHSSCPWAHVCGIAGDPSRRCEVGYCCFDGDGLYGQSSNVIAPPRSSTP